MAVVGIEVTSGAQPQPDTPTIPPNSTAVVNIRELVGSLTVVDKLDAIGGYERSCAAGKGCSFGQSWTDDYDGPGAHNGCDTRNDVLAAQLEDVVHKPGSRGCKVQSGTLHDPYTGATIAFTSEEPSQVQIDHVFPLARAWKAGASRWTTSQRVRFANDLDLNLLAVAGIANQSKSDQGLDTWVPKNASFACEYVRRYLSVAQRYQLMVTRAEVATALAGCP